MKQTHIFLVRTASPPTTSGGIITKKFMTLTLSLYLFLGDISGQDVKESEAVTDISYPNCQPSDHIRGDNHDDKFMTLSLLIYFR